MVTEKFIADQHGRLSLFFLPPYFPQLNPDERVWKHVKHDRVGRLAARTKDEMRDAINKAVTRMQETASIVRGFFHEPDLSYIGA